MNLFSFSLSPSRLGFPQMYLLFKCIPLLSFAVFFFCVYRAWMYLISFFFPSAFSSGVFLGFLGSRVWGIASTHYSGVILGMRKHQICHVLIKKQHTMTAHVCPNPQPRPPWRIHQAFLGGFCSALCVWHDLCPMCCPGAAPLPAPDVRQSPATPTTPAQTLWQKERNCWGFFSQFGQPLNVLRETSCQGYFQFCRLLYPKLWSWHVSEPS